MLQLASNPGFANLWVAVLNRAEGYLKSSSQRSGGRSEDGMSLAENIPELLKNMLLVRGLLDLSWPSVKRLLPAWTLLCYGDRLTLSSCSKGQGRGSLVHQAVLFVVEKGKMLRYERETHGT
jgi:hypothetical protein